MECQTMLNTFLRSLLLKLQVCKMLQNFLFDFLKVVTFNIVICSFQEMLKLKESGRVRHVGVSNMNEEQLGRLCAVEKPACLQVEVHVLFQQKQLIAAANRLGIPVVAYSPLGSKALADALAAKTG